MLRARTYSVIMRLFKRVKQGPRTVHGDTHYQLGDMVLLRRGRLPEGSKFQARMWLGP